MNSKELLELKRERAKSELMLRLNGFIDGFQSNEEPEVKLTLRDKVEVLSKFVTSHIPRLLNPKN